jgi:uncharacterized OB-fold protein
MPNENHGLNELLDMEGMSGEEFLEYYAFHGIVPGICKNCGAVYNYEPDQDKGWCDQCEKNTVVSGLMLMGVI